MLLDFDIDTVLRAAIVLIRVACIVYFLPLYGEHYVPPQIRIGLSLALSLCIFPVLPKEWGLHLFQTGMLNLGFQVLKEVALGFSIGFLSKTLFEGIVGAASLVGYQMGFGTSNLILYGSDHQESPFAILHQLLLLLLFLTLNFHQILIHAIFTTFQSIPVGGFSFTPFLGSSLLAISSLIFSTALQLAAPLLVSLLLTLAALGLLTRAVPQLNVFSISFPVGYFVGLLMYVAMLPFFPDWIKTYFLAHFEWLFENLLQFGVK